MKYKWPKLIVGPIVAEIAAIMVLVCLVAILGPKEAAAAQVFAERLGQWDGPIAGAAFSLLGSFLVARPSASHQIAYGALFGCFMALFDMALLVAMRPPFEWLFVASDGGKIIAGLAGGWLAARFRDQKEVQGASV